MRKCPSAQEQQNTSIQCVNPLLDPGSVMEAESSMRMTVSYFLRVSKVFSSVSWRMDVFSPSVVVSQISGEETACVHSVELYLEDLLRVGVVTAFKLRSRNFGSEYLDGSIL
jgi:hypothetical protein